MYVEKSAPTKISANSIEPNKFPGKKAALFMYPKNIPNNIGIVSIPQTGQTAIINLNENIFNEKLLIIFHNF